MGYRRHRVTARVQMPEISLTHIYSYCQVVAHGTTCLPVEVQVTWWSEVMSNG